MVERRLEERKAHGIREVFALLTS